MTDTLSLFHRVADSDGSLQIVADAKGRPLVASTAHQFRGAVDSAKAAGWLLWVADYSREDANQCLENAVRELSTPSQVIGSGRVNVWRT